MGKILKGLVAALTVAGALAAAAPAEARHDGWGRGWHGDRGWGGRGWGGDRGDRGWDRGWRGDRWRGYGGRDYYGPSYGYGYGYPRYRHRYYDHDHGDAAIAAIAGIAIGAAIASSGD